MSSNNLTDNQKDLLRKLVGCVKEGKLKEPILAIFSQTAGHFIQVPEEDPIRLKFGDLEALRDGALINFRAINNNYNISIKQAGYAAVDNNFEAATSGDARKKISEERLESLFRQLEVCSRNLSELEEQASQHGAIDVPTKLRNEIRETKIKKGNIEKEIAELQEVPEPEVVKQRPPAPGDSQNFQKEQEVELEVPLLQFSQEIPPKKGLPTKGIQFTDKDPTGKDGPPVLYLSVYFKQSKYFLPYSLGNEKWLYLEANMRPAFNLRIQVYASGRDVYELLEFLSNGRDGYDLHGPRPENDKEGDYFLVWREKDENRLMISTFTATNAGISIHARFSDKVAKALADYLKEIGFTEGVTPPPQSR